MAMLVTGGYGFIGSNFIRYTLETHPEIAVINLDKLTYAGNPENLRDIASRPHYTFIKGDICDPPVVHEIFKRESIDTVVHFAAESHVDRSISDASSFIRTNVLGTFTLLDVALNLDIKRFIHISTDEVYGSIATGSFAEDAPLNPSSPYSSSKASSDLIARSYFITHGLPVIITRCTNNYGPYQYPEKLIPLFITNLIEGKSVPVYGTGTNVRDWIHVLDHCRAIDCVLEKGTPGEIYNIGSNNERSNIEITRKILLALGKDESSINYVKDRPGHDFRYSLDSSKLRSLGWTPNYSFEEGLHETIEWYRANTWWWHPLKHPR
jgi:dTDP-glucose 4,6-dehydratase